MNYVPYETDSFARAYSQAAHHIGRRYPGGVEILTALDGLIKQFLNAEK